MRRILKTLGTGRYWHDELLPYWHEGTDYTWTKLDLQEGDNEIYVYYGSSTATDESNGDDVFEFFDDFEGTDLDPNKWGTIENTNYSVESSYFKAWGGWDQDGIFSAATFDLSEGIVVEWKGRLGVTGADVDLYVGFTPDKSSSGDENIVATFYDSQGTAEPYHQKQILYKVGGTSDQTGYGLPNTTNWVRMTSTFTQTQTVFTDEILGTHTKSKTVSWSSVYLTIGADSDDAARYGYIDWLAVRKYSSSPPSISYSSEESGSWTIDGHVFTKRKKVTITASQSVEGYQVRLSYSQWNDPNLRILHRVTKYIRGDF